MAIGPGDHVAVAVEEALAPGGGAEDAGDIARAEGFSANTAMVPDSEGIVNFQCKAVPVILPESDKR